VASLPAVLTAPRLPRLARGRKFDWSLLAWLLAAVLLGILVLVPLGYLAVSSVQDRAGSFTLQNFRVAYTTRIYLEPLLSSFQLAIVVAVLSTLIGVPMAWAVSRTDMPGRALIRAAVLAAFITPSFLGAIAWIFLAAPNSGWINRWFVALTHAEHGPINIYSLAGCMFVISLYSFPYTFTFVSSALDLVSSEMEDAANILGAGTWRTSFHVTLPLVLPAIAAGFIMSFLEAIELLGPPAFLLIPARRLVATTQLWQFFNAVPPRVELAAAYAMPLLLVTIALLFLQRRLLARRRFTSLTGKGGQKRPLRLGRWKYVLLAFCLLITSLTLILPYGALLVTSLSKVWGQPLVVSNLTLHWYQWAIQTADARLALRNSLVYSTAAATLASVLAIAIAYIASRRLLPGARILGFVAMAPFVVPGIVLAVGFFAAYAHPPLLLYGTAWILILAFATRFLPIAYASSNSVLQSVNPDLENAARTLGASRLRTLMAVTGPLLRRGLMGGWLLVFIPALKELSCAVLLFTNKTRVVTTVMFDYSDAGNYEAVATLGMVMMLISFAVVLIAYRFLGRDFLLSRPQRA
jgi:iron(III) transport system permease protein